MLSLFVSQCSPVVRAHITFAPRPCRFQVRRMRSAMLLKNISRRYDRHAYASALARWVSVTATEKEVELLKREYEERQKVYGSWRKVRPSLRRNSSIFRDSKDAATTDADP